MTDLSVSHTDGEMAARFAELDWSQTPLGATDSWPLALRSAVGICLGSRFPILIWWGPDLVMLYNDAYRPMLGSSKHPQALGAPGKAVWPEIWEIIGPMLDSVMGGNGATWSADQLLALDRNGYVEECYFTFSFSPIEDESGAVGGVFCAVTETTERVLAERRQATVSTLSTRLAQVTDEADVRRTTTQVLAENRLDHPLAVMLTAADLATDVDNEASTALDDLPPDLREPVLDIARTALASGHPEHVDTPLANAGTPPPSGELAIGGLHARPISAVPGSGPGAVLVIGHSAQRPWDQGLATYLARCASQVANAVGGLRDLATQRLRADNLAALDEAKTAFFTNISHELRTPLTLIQGPVEEALSSPVLDERLRARLEVVSRNTTRLARMVDALLDFERIEAGHLEPHRELEDVAAFTRQLAASFTSAFEQAGLGFELELPPGSVRAHVDRDMYERIVLNLLGNALKYTSAGHVALRLVATEDGFEVSVRDTGFGVSAVDAERIFERFERLASPDGARSREGAGIGLAMVKQLTELHGGSVELSSVPGVGSTFTARFPHGAPHAEPSSPSITPRHVDDFLAETDRWAGPHVTDPLPRSDNGRPRLLVAEDNPDMCDYLLDVLGEDYEVQFVVDGRAALEAARANRPDIVLADVMMPVLDGFELVTAIREDISLADLPVVLVSARAGDRDTSTGLRAGADDYLVKPFSVRELRARLESNLERSRARLRDAAWRRAVMHAYQDPFAIADESGTVLEVNQAFTDLLGWSGDDLPIPVPHPWWPTADDDDADGQAERRRILDAIGHAAWEEPVEEEFHVVAKDGRHLWVRAQVRRVERHGDRPGFIIGTVRDVTREHDSLERRRAAAVLSREFGSAQDLEQVLTAAVTGFAELFDGDSFVRAVAGPEDHLFTAAGPVHPEDLDPEVRSALEDSAAEVGSTDVPVRGLLLVPDPPTSTCRVWVQFRRPRIVSTDERIVGDLLAQAFGLAVDRLVAASGFADREAHLAKAIESHRLIGQAIGILIERHRTTPQEAFTMLKEASQARNIKLREIASRVIETGAEPDEAE